MKTMTPTWSTLYSSEYPLLIPPVQLSRLPFEITVTINDVNEAPGFTENAPTTLTIVETVVDNAPRCN